jgi:Predicted AAA-ATPase/PD-(D/E)XK nuclease superfamily
MIKIMYGNSNYKSLITEGGFYIDRTRYIETLESFGPKNLVYLRPRRFGKSLLISTLYYYYSLNFKSEFDTLFGKTYIGQNPTSKAHQYMVLKFDFSGINTDTFENAFDGFLNSVIGTVSFFLSQHNDFFTKEQTKEILNQKQPSEVVKTLFKHCADNNIPYKVYVLIDEYDHFTNELLSFNFSYFKSIVGEDGFVRKFYEVLKTGSGNNIIDYIFITGVSSVTIDSLTSGFNIPRNITLLPKFHQMVGFEESEVVDILEQIEIPKDDIAAVLHDVRLWYNGYLFSPDATKRLYNPNMVLYFAQEYQELQHYPYEMLDVNIASDYSKIQKLFNIQGREKDYLEILQTLSETGEYQAQLVTQYTLTRQFNYSDLTSLLFYMGFLTLKESNLKGYTFSFPNYALRQLYGDYFFNILKNGDLAFDAEKLRDAIVEMATTANAQPFFDYVQRIIKVFSTRDAKHFNENTLKAIVISLLFQQRFYYIHSEYETDWHYMDIFLEPTAGHKPNYQVAFELKYVEKAGAKRVKSLITEASAQLKGYLDSPKFNTKTNIKSWAMVLVGEKLHWKEVISPPSV